MRDYKSDVIDTLKKLYLLELSNKDRFKSRAYKNVLNQLQQTAQPIYSLEDMKAIEGVGKGILNRVDKIIKGKKITQLKYFDKKMEQINNIAKVQGIGDKKAKELVEKYNIKSVSELKRHPEHLNDLQKKGIKYYNAFSEKIPAKEIVKHCDFINKIVKEIDNKFIIIPVGSFRRKLAHVDKIDLVVTSKFNFNLKDIIDKLASNRYIKDEFVRGTSKFFGVCSLSNKLRHINILSIKYDKYPFALLYFTGPSLFNLKMRKFARDKGYHLSEHGLKHYRGESKNMYINKQLKSEKDIFNFLGLKYISPAQRNDNINLKDYLL